MTWAVVQSAGGLTFATSITVTFTTANVSSGSKIIAYVASAASTAPSSVSDGAGHNLTLVASAVAVSPAGGAWVYAMDVPVPGTKPAITASGLASTGLTMIVQEVSGLAPGNTAAMIDGTPGTLTGTATSSGSPSYTSAAAGEYLICMYGDNQGATPTFFGAPWTKDPSSQVSQSHASLEYANSTGGAETSGWTSTSTTGWEVLTAAFRLAPAAAPAVTPPPLILPHPHFTSILLGEAWQRADWQAQGVADLTVAYASTAGGVDTYNVTSPWNLGVGASQPQQMRVLPPAAPNPGYPHAFLIMLPVASSQNTGVYGDPIGVAQGIGAHNQYNLTCVQPGYAQSTLSAEGPWFADNPLAPGLSQEKFTLLVTAWIRQNLTTAAGQEKVYLIGFSRSGLGGQHLFFRHEDLFAAVASWDAPFMMTDYDGTDPNGVSGGHPEAVYGTSVSFKTNYELDTHLAGWKATGQYAVNRIWVGRGPDFGDTPAYDAALTAAGIPHTYTFANTVEAHAWQADWVAAALASMIPSNYAQAATVLPQQIPRPLFTQLLQVAAWRTPVAAPPPPAITGTGSAAGTSAATAAGTVIATGSAAGAGAGAASAAGTIAAAGTAAGAGSVAATGGVIAPQAATGSAAGAAAVTAKTTIAATGSAAAAAAVTATGRSVPPFTVGFLTAATQRTGGPGG